MEVIKNLSMITAVNQEQFTLFILCKGKTIKEFTIHQKD